MLPAGTGDSDNDDDDDDDDGDDNDDDSTRFTTSIMAGSASTLRSRIPDP